MLLKLVALLFSLSIIVRHVEGYSIIDCRFQKRSFDPMNKVKKTQCGYQRGWYSMQRANWNVVNVSRDGKIKERDSETAGGYFAYFEARKRPIGYVSRLISLTFTLHADSCLTFYYVNKGPKQQYPFGRSKLQVFFHTKGRLPTKDDVPLWSGTNRTGRNKWKKVQVRIYKDTIKNINGKIVFQALRGRNKKSYLAIDDVKLTDCGGKSFKKLHKYYYDRPAQRVGTPAYHSGAYKRPNDLRILAAKTNTHTREFFLPPGSPVQPGSLALPRTDYDADAGRRHRGKSRRNRRKKGRRQREEEYNIVYLPEDPTQQTQSEEKFVPTLITENTSTRPEVLCDFTEYTHGLKRCMRVFFSMLKHNKSKRKCNALFATLESCLQDAATRCVPSTDMTKQEVETLVRDTLRQKFKTQQVYCQEEGAFIYPEFSLGALPLQCNQQYFLKLTQCGGSFSGIFNIKHGDPNLCREYYTANECQRKTTALECNFETRTMLVYGLNLQYQFAHNPFCIDLPFSAWWPNS